MPETPDTYTFERDGRTYHLPSGDTVVDKIPGKVLRDAYMDGDEGEMRLSFALLEALDSDAGAVEALYSMPAPEMLSHIRAWTSFKPSEEAASLGESSDSND